MRLFSVANNSGGNLNELMPQLTQIATAAAKFGFLKQNFDNLLNY